MVLICDKAIFCGLDSSGSHKIAKHKDESFQKSKIASFISLNSADDSFFLYSDG